MERTKTFPVTVYTIQDRKHKYRCTSIQIQSINWSMSIGNETSLILPHFKGQAIFPRDVIYRIEIQGRLIFDDEKTLKNKPLEKGQEAKAS